MEPATRTYDQWIGRDAYDSHGEKIGEVTDIFYDDETKRPEWLAVKTGLFGTKHTFVPIHGSSVYAGGSGSDNDIQVAFDKDMIKEAPRIDADQHMSPAEERELWQYYGYDYGSRKDTAYGPNYTGPRADKDFAYRRYDRADNTWTEKEQRLEEHTEEVPVHASVEIPIDTTVRLRRYQTQNQKTETRTVQVPVTETEEHVEVVDVDADAKMGQAKTRVEDTNPSTRRK